MNTFPFVRLYRNSNQTHGRINIGYRMGAHTHTHVRGPGDGDGDDNNGNDIAVRTIYKIHESRVRTAHGYVKYAPMLLRPRRVCVLLRVCVCVFIRVFVGNSRKTVMGHQRSRRVRRARARSRTHASPWRAPTVRFRFEYNTLSVAVRRRSRAAAEQLVVCASTYGTRSARTRWSVVRWHWVWKLGTG